MQEELTHILEVTPQAISYRLKSRDAESRSCTCEIQHVRQMLFLQHAITGDEKWNLHDNSKKRKPWKVLKERCIHYYSRHAKIMLSHDKARPHSKPIWKHWKVLPPSQYSPDIVLCD